MAMQQQQARWRFTVEDYHKMGDAGILTEDDRVELVDGEIVQMTPINIPHAVCVGLLNMAFAPIMAGRGLVWVQNPISIDDFNEPQPDILIIKPHDYLREQRHPGPDDILLLIEVSDSTLTYDRRFKMPRYARAGVVESWVVNLSNGTVEVYTDPQGGKYKSMRKVGKGEAITLAALPDVTVQVESFLGLAPK